MKLPAPANIIFSTVEVGGEKGGHVWKVASVTTAGLQETKLTKSILDGINASALKVKDLGSILVILMTLITMKFTDN